MIAVMSALFLVALDQTIIATALSKIVTDFNAFSSLGFVITAYLLLSTVTVPLAGKMSDMFGRRPVLLTGVIVFTLGSLLSGMSHSIEQLIAFRALQGFGGGIIMANAFTIIGDLFTPRERGKWQGIFAAVFGLSSVIGPLLGGWLTDSHRIFGMTTDWRWTFFINVPVGIFAAAIVARYCPSIRHEKKPVVDWAGAALLTIALSSLVLAVDNTEAVFKFMIDAGWTITAIKTALFSMAALFGAAFVWAETKAKEPIIPLRFFKNRTFTSIMIAFLLFGAAFLGAILYLTQFNQQVFGADATEAGLMLLPFMAGMAIASALSGQIASRTGKYKRLIIGGFVVATISVFMLTGLHANTPYWHEAIIMFFIGLGLGTGMPIMNLAVQNEFEQRDLGAATASTQLFRGLGSTVGTAVLSGMLTAGITSNIGTIQSDPYIESLKQSPAAAKMLPSPLTTDSLLQINTQGSAIKQQAHEAIDKAPIPPIAKDAQKSRFDTTQKEFSEKVVDAFTKSLSTIFLVSGFLMIGALIAVLFVRERKLRGGSEGAPGVE